MRFEPLSIHKAFRVRIEPQLDVRGFFARTFCTREFAEAGLPGAALQSSISFNAKRGTVRGMHFQWPPSQEGKLVRCLKGGILDVLIDLRPHSPTYLRHTCVALDGENRDGLFIPHGVAHGFQTLTDSTEVFYQMTDYYTPELGAGVRWNDRTFNIDWPMRSGIVISERDDRYPDFDRRAFEMELARRSAAGAW